MGRIFFDNPTRNKTFSRNFLKNMLLVMDTRYPVQLMKPTTADFVKNEGAERGKMHGAGFFITVDAQLVLKMKKCSKDSRKY